MSTPASTPAATPSPRRRLAFLRPSHQHTATSATLLLGAFALLSRVIGLVRDKYIAHTFGAGPATDAYNVAFQLPDLISYLLVGGAASISFVTILSRYRERGEHAAGDRALSVILNTMLLVLGAAILLAELAAPLYTRAFFAGDPAQVALSTTMTRILLPAQVFFFAGGVLTSVTLVRKQFTYQGISPLIYTAGIIVGGLLFAHTLGIPSLAWGALLGAFLGPFALNAWAAHRAGVRYQPILDLHDPGLRDWVRMSLPLMLGVSVVFMDSIILTWFAKHTAGQISELMYAKRLFTAPMAIIGQAAGAASLPFFASLFAQGRHTDYAAAVNRSVSRILAVALLLAGAMFALSGPLVDLVLRGGALDATAAHATALFFAIFTLSLPLWSAQAIYARGFYAAGETRAPMIGGTLITAASLPLYWSLHRASASPASPGPRTSPSSPRPSCSPSSPTAAASSPSPALTFPSSPAPSPPPSSATPPPPPPPTSSPTPVSHRPSSPACSPSPSAASPGSPPPSPFSTSPAPPSPTSSSAAAWPPPSPTSRSPTYHSPTMDPVTHLMTGACLARTGFNRRTRYATLVMVLAAEAPDLDTLWGLGGPIASFQHHRGWTHTFLGLPVDAAVVVGAVWLFDRWQSRRKVPVTASSTKPAPLPARWPFLFLCALIALLSHLLLDWTNNYGLRPFFPFNPRWYAGSFVFIVEPVMLLLLFIGLVAPALFGLI